MHVLRLRPGLPDRARGATSSARPPTGAWRASTRRSGASNERARSSATRPRASGSPTDLDANLCVEAGAGTGKTTVLVKRVVNLLASGTVDVGSARGDHVHREGGGRARHARARRARATRPRAPRGRSALGCSRRHATCIAPHIETIHSFAAALLRERPVEAGIDPLFEVLDGLAAGLEFDKAYERFQDELFRSRARSSSARCAAGSG